jgi:hypothetical protein
VHHVLLAIVTLHSRSLSPPAKREKTDQPDHPDINVEVVIPERQERVDGFVNARWFQNPDELVADARKMLADPQANLSNDGHTARSSSMA